MVCDHLSCLRLAVVWGGRCGTKSWSKTLSPMRVSGWFVIVLAVGAWGGLVEAAAAPKVGLKPSLPCGFRGGL